MTELADVGLQSNRALVISDRNIYWLSQSNDVMLYGKDGIKNISLNKINITNAEWHYSPTDRSIYMFNADNITNVYQIDYDYFYNLNSDLYTSIISIAETYDGLRFNTDSLWRAKGTVNLTGSILSGFIPARMKIKRFYSTKDLSLTISLYSAKVGTGTQVTKYILYWNGEKKVFIGSGLSGSLVNSNTIYL